MQTTKKNMMASVASPVRKRIEEDVLQLLIEYRRCRDLRLRDKIVLQHTNLVESIARRFSGASEPAEDLAQEGYIGLITAIDLYDATKNVKFSTYATHFIIGQIKHCLRDRGKIIKEPAWLQELNQRMTRVIASLTQDLGRPPANEEIAKMMGMSEENVAEMMMTREIFKVTSIDGGSNDDDDGSTVNLDRKQGLDVAVSFQLPVEERIVLEAAMQKLKELEQKVVSEFYFKDLNQTEIAHNLGISCNYVSHILRNSTKKLKKIIVTDELRDARLKMSQVRRRIDEQQAARDQEPVVDAQTRLYNRHYFENRLQEEISRASRTTSELAVLFVYIEGLSEVAKTHGTLKADEALLNATTILRDSVRRVDILTRYSDSLFALILPHTGRNVDVVERRLDQAFHSWFRSDGWSTGRRVLRFFSGQAIYPADATTAQELTHLAQERLEQATETPALPIAA